MTFRFNYTLFLFFISITFSHAQDNSLKNYLQNSFSTNQFFDSINTSIADQIISKKKNYTALSGMYYNSKENNAIQQKGNGLDHLSFHVTSNYSIDSMNYVWGNVFYKNGTRKNVKWNESSDYDKISPYVMADSVGGNLSLEEYYIEGGYNRRMKNLNFGIKADYRALMEYRNRDPRPKNTISDLNFGIGLSSKITTEKIISLNILLNKYSQANELKFFNELGNPEVFHFNGLGIYSNLFRNNNKRVYFDGNGYGFQLAYLNSTKKGLMGSVGYSTSSIEKILTNLQSLVSSTINEDKYSFNISYSTPDISYFKGIKLSSQFRNRKGTEGIFFNETSSNYKKIGEATRYDYNEKVVELSSLFDIMKNAKLQNLSLSPFIKYISSEEKYTDPLIKQTIEKLIVGLNTNLFYELNDKTLLNFKVDFGVNNNLSNEWLSNYTYQKPSIEEMMNQNYQYLTSNYWFINLAYRHNYILSDKYTIFLESKYKYASFKQSDYNSYFDVSIGFFF
ncbi:DUF6850 family outer membrane beta-barrel protein [Chishuiella changwenlii]|uniref:DUF6850 family outer membrane beta-barrel protein n=1 Tax=Chishuiella changwenlii TaxID=1434701 RepID=UPI002FD8F587